MKKYVQKHHPQYDLTELERMMRELREAEASLNTLNVQHAVLNAERKKFTENTEFYMYGHVRHVLIENLLYEGHSENFTNLFCEVANKMVFDVLKENPGPLPPNGFLIKKDIKPNGNFGITKLFPNE